MNQRFWNTLIRGLCFAFWWQPEFARRILTAAYGPRRYTVADLNPLSLQLIARIHEMGSWEPHDAELYRDVLARMNDPLAPIPPLPQGNLLPEAWHEIPGIDWQREQVGDCPDVAAVAGLPMMPLNRLAVDFVWIASLIFAENRLANVSVPVMQPSGVVVPTQMTVEAYLLNQILRERGIAYFNGSPRRTTFLRYLYAGLPVGPLDCSAAHSTMQQLRANAPPAWFLTSATDTWSCPAEREFVRATFRPGLGTTHLLEFPERQAVFLIYKGQLSLAEILSLLASNANWATSADVAARQLQKCFTDLFREMPQGGSTTNE